MAENIRDGRAEEAVKLLIEQIVAESRRQEESCRYTAANLYIWQKQANRWRRLFLVAPIILGGFASSQLLLEYWGVFGKILAAFSGVLAGFFPAIYVSLNMDMQVIEIARAAGEFTNLRDRFRQFANFKSASPQGDVEAEFEALMDRMDAIRMSAPAAPEWCFKEAQEKIGSGDYSFSTDKETS